MTLQQLEQGIKRFAPDFNFRQAGYGDVVGCFFGNDYLIRMSKGDVPLMTYRIAPKKGVMDEWNKAKGRDHLIDKGSKKRGRMHLLNWLVNRRILTSRQAQQIMWGNYE